MSKHITRIRTESGDLQIDYNALANLPTLSSFGISMTADEINALSGHTHNYAGSSSSGGAATSANKLNTNAGSATQPIYFSKGVPVATTYTLEKSVPSNAVFTDTTNLSSMTGTLGIAKGGTGATTKAAAIDNLGIKDYIVEYGRVGYTTYRKWDSGLMEMWYQTTLSNQKIDTAYGSLFYGTHIWTFPIEFVNVDCVQCAYFRWGTGASWGGVMGSTTTYAELCGYDCVARGTDDTCVVAAYAQGWWR